MLGLIREKLVRKNYISGNAILGLGAVTFFISSLYLFIGTGLHGDDYSAIQSMRHQTLADFLSRSQAGKSLTIHMLPVYYLLWWPYQVFGHELQWIYDVIKWVVHMGSVAMVYVFATSYLPRARAAFAALVFVFFPIHDATTYWYMASPYILTASVVMYAHHLVRQGNYPIGIFVLLLGAFSNYSSPPYLFGLAAIFLVERRTKDGTIFAAAGLAYVLVYILIGIISPDVEKRIEHGQTLDSLIGNVAIQVGSSLDAVFGPSMWIKLYSSVSLLTWPVLGSIMLVSVVAAIPCQRHAAKANKSLLIGLVLIVTLSWLMFAATGRYAQTPFNLGNRVTIYGSLFLAFVLATINFRLLTRVGLIFVLMAAVVGTSVHWKQWNNHQQEVIKNIALNPGLASLGDEAVVIVSGNIYSKLGPYSHIEFFSMPWHLDAVLSHAGVRAHAIALSPTVNLRGRCFTDSKIGVSRETCFEERLFHYDSDSNVLKAISQTEAEVLAQNRPQEVRHWIQTLKSSYIASMVVKVSPRLEYLFK